MAIGPILRYGWTQIKEDDKRKGKMLAGSSSMQQQEPSQPSTYISTQIYI